MNKPLPAFRFPPVIETALSVQFQPLKVMSNAHLGLFWDRVRGQYPLVQDADPIEPQIERFGSEVPRARFPQFRIAAAQPATRLRMSSECGHRMLQLQNGRLIFNWRRLDGTEDYPRWTSVMPLFLEATEALRGLASDENLGTIEHNQWEVTYVNHLVRGREWENSADWKDMLPGVIGTTEAVSTGSFESMSSYMHYVLPQNRGRLHIELSHGFSGPDEDCKELVVLQLTARGGVDQTHGLEDGLKLGREVIVRSFSEISGKAVRGKIWEQEA